jgi:antitoxin MazE
MKAKLISIGNSRGIRLPKAVLDECGLTDEITLEVQKDRLIVRSSSTARRNWDAAFARMRARGDDALLDIAESGLTEDWDRTEWKW